jgi:hypothetical protein
MSSETLELLEGLTVKLRKEFDERMWLWEIRVDGQGHENLSGNEMAGRSSTKSSRQNYRLWRSFSKQ